MVSRRIAWPHSWPRALTGPRPERYPSSVHLPTAVQCSKNDRSPALAGSPLGSLLSPLLTPTLAPLTTGMTPTTTAMGSLGINNIPALELDGSSSPEQEQLPALEDEMSGLDALVTGSYLLSALNTLSGLAVAANYQKAARCAVPPPPHTSTTHPLPAHSPSPLPPPNHPPPTPHTRSLHTHPSLPPSPNAVMCTPPH